MSQQIALGVRSYVELNRRRESYGIQLRLAPEVQRSLLRILDLFSFHVNFFP